MAFFLFLSAIPAQADDNVSVFKLGERFFSDSLYSLALEQYQKYLSLKNRPPEYDPLAHFKVGVIYYRTDDMRRAAEAFEEYITLFPSEPDVMEAMYLAGEARKKLGDFKEASDWFHSVWSRFVGSARARHALYQAAVCAEKDNNSERASELYGVFLARFPDHENAKNAALSLVTIHMDQKQYALAQEALAKAEGLRSRSDVFAVRLLYYRALLSQRMQKTADAEKFYEAMKKKDPGSFPEREQAYTNYIALLSAQKKYAESLEAFERIQELYQAQKRRMPGDLLASWAENARRAHKYERAAELYGTLVDQYQDEVSTSMARYRLAECQVGAGNLPKAIETLQELEAGDTTGEYASRAVLKIGDLYFSKGLYPSAIGAYRRYLQLPVEENKDFVLYRIGKIYQEKYQRSNAALREFENLLKWHPSSPYYTRALFAVAECYEAVGEYQAAIRQYDFLIESGGDEQLVARTQERVRYLKEFKIRDAETAAYALTNLMERSPEKLSAYERLQTAADIYERHLKDFTRALDAYEKIAALGPLPNDSLSAYVLYRHGGVYQKLCEKARMENDSNTAAYACEKAVGFFRKALAEYPRADCADDAAFRVLSLEKPQISAYESFLETYPGSDHLAEVLLSIGRHYDRGAGEAGKRFSGKAVAAYSRIVNEFPQTRYASAALMGLARNYLAKNELDSVSATVTLFLERFPGSADEPEALFLKGSVAKKRGAHKEAAELYRQVLYRYPFSPFASRSRLEVAFAELASGNVFDALNNFRVYERTYPDGDNAYRARYGIAKCLLRIGKAEQAVSALQELLAEKLPEAVEADIQMELARFNHDSGDSYAAIKHYKKALSYKGLAHRRDALVRLGGLNFDSRIYDEAAKAYEQALELSRTRQDSSDAMVKLITSLTMNGQDRKADAYTRDFKERFGEKNAEMAEIIYYEGVYLQVEKKYDNAINRFKYILAKHEQSDRCDDAAYQIALAHYYGGNHDQALKLFYNFPTKYPQSEFAPLAFFKVGMIYHGRNDFAQAAKFFEKVVEHPETDTKTRFRAAHNSAVAYQKISAWLDAARLYSLVLKEFPEEQQGSSMHLKIGFCLVQASRIEEALTHFLKANENPAEEDKPEILYWIGTCYGKLGEYQRAISEYLKVPYLYAGIGKWGITAEFEAARLYERLGEHQKAVTLYKKIVRSDGERGRFGRQAQDRIDRLSNLAEKQ